MYVFPFYFFCTASFFPCIQFFCSPLISSSFSSTLYMSYFGGFSFVAYFFPHTPRVFLSLPNFSSVHFLPSHFSFLSPLLPSASFLTFLGSVFDSPVFLSVSQMVNESDSTALIHRKNFIGQYALRGGGVSIEGGGVNGEMTE